MKLFVNLIKFLFFTLIFSYSAIHIYAQDNKTPKILWQKDFECGNNISCSFGAVTYDNNSNRLLVVGTTFRPERAFHPTPFSDGKFRLWEIDVNGNEIKDIILKDAPQKIGKNLRDTSILIKDAIASNNGYVFAIGSFNDLTQSFMKMDQKGKIIFCKSIAEKSSEENDILINKIILLSNNNALLIGNKNRSDGLIIKVDSEGNKLWEKVYDKGQVEFFTDGVSVNTDGDFLIVGYSTKPAEDSSSPDPSNIWILRCDAEGNMISEEVFQGGYPLSGREPRICKLDSENFALAYDKSTLIIPINHRIRIFNSELKVLCEKSFIESEKGSPSFFKLMPLSDGSFVVANCVTLKDVNIYRYDKGCNQLSSISLNKAIWGRDFSIVSVKDKVFVISKALSDKDGTFKIRIISIQI